MNRRAFLAGTVSAALARPRGTQAQPPISRIGFLSGRSPAESRFVTDAFILGLREMGYVYAIIGAAGPVRFYQKTVGAIIIPDSEPGIYTDILKK